MTFTAKLIDKVKENKKLDSDYAVAKLIGVRPTQISQWRKRNEANAYYTLVLSKLAGLDLEMSLKIVTEYGSTPHKGKGDEVKECILC